MLDRDEIEEKLKGVDHQLIVAFAARCSLRVFPLLVADKGEDDFWYWAGEKRASCVLELFVAQRFNTNFLIFSNKHTPTARVDTALFTAESAIRSTIFEGVTGKSDISSAKTVISSVNAIGNALNKKYITTKAIKAIAETTSLRMWLGRPTRTAVNTAIYATQAYANVEEEIYRDLEIINNRKNSFFKGKKSKAIFAVDFFYSPLWQHSPPQDWQLLCTKFYNALIGLDEGFELWVDWYKDRLEGVPLDLEQEEKGLNIPVEIQEQGAKASNCYLAGLNFPQINNERFSVNQKEVEKIPYQQLFVEAKLEEESTVSDAENQYSLQKITELIMTMKKQENEGVNVTYNIENVGALGGVGDNHTVTGTINLNSDQKKDVADLQKLLGVLIKDVEKFDDSIVKKYAHDELKEIQKDLGDIDNASPEIKNKLTKSLTSLKEGSLGAIKFLKTAKDSAPTITWAMEKAAIVWAWLAATPPL